MPKAFPQKFRDDMIAATAHDPGLPDGPVEGRVDVHFLFMLPQPLAMPSGEQGAPIDFHTWDRDRALRAFNKDPIFAEADLDPMKASIAIQLVHNVITHESPRTGLEALMNAMPLIWPWLREGDSQERANPQEPLVLPRQDTDASVVSVRVAHQDGIREWELDQNAYIADCLDQAISACQDLERAVGLITKEPAPLLTAPTLPMVIPCSVLLNVAGVGPTRTLKTFLIPNDRSLELTTIRTGRALPVEDVQAALAATEAENPFIPVQDLIRDAMWSVAIGSYWSALIQAAAFAELLIHTTARFLCWEEGMTPEGAASDLMQSSSSMLAFASSHVGGRVGGNWDGTLEGPVGAWSIDLIKKRNAVLHAGLGVSEEDAQRGIDAALALADFVKSRLVSQRSLPNFPLTAVAMMGEPGLKTRGRFTNRVRAATEEVGPTFMSRFRHWREYMEAGPMTDEPDPEDCMLVAVLESDSDGTDWVLRALDTTWAAKAELTDALPDTVVDALADARQRLRESAHPRTAVSIPGIRSWKKVSECWEPAYRLIPGHGCLRHFKDLETVDS